MEQLIILLVIGVISFVNWLIKQSAEARERKKQEQRRERGDQSTQVEEPLREPQMRRTAPEPVEEDPAESMRKLMEALGLPMENEPPPRPVRQARPQAPEPPPLPAPVFQAPEPPPIPRKAFVDPYAQKTDRPARRTSFQTRNENSEIELPQSLESELAPAKFLHDWTKDKNRPTEKVVAAERRQVRQLLSSPHGLREAMILSEVLGKPKALRD